MQLEKNKPETRKTKIEAIRRAVKLRNEDEREELKALVNKTGETDWVKVKGREYCITKRYGLSLYLLVKPLPADDA